MFASQLTSQYEKPLIYFLIKKIEVQEIMTQIKHDLWLDMTESWLKMVKYEAFRSLIPSC